VVTFTAYPITSWCSFSQQKYLKFLSRPVEFASILTHTGVPARRFNRVPQQCLNTTLKSAEQYLE